MRHRSLLLAWRTTGVRLGAPGAGGSDYVLPEAAQAAAALPPRLHHAISDVPGSSTGHSSTSPRSLERQAGNQQSPLTPQRRSGSDVGAVTSSGGGSGQVLEVDDWAAVKDKVTGLTYYHNRTTGKRGEKGGGRGRAVWQCRQRRRRTWGWRGGGGGRNTRAGVALRRPFSGPRVRVSSGCTSAPPQ